jgi:hypothetical protein
MTAAVAEQVNYELREHELEFNRERVHLSIVPDLIESCRPAESEIYGRSLSTIHRLGAFMIENSLEESIRSPEAEQARVEFYTSVQEGFGTDMELGGGLEVRDFDTRPLDNGKVMAKNDKTPVSGMTQAGLLCAVETAKKDERFLPQLTRSEWDHKNALLVDSMARKETPYNTRIVISPFPEEAAAQSGDKYWQGIGYVPHLRRGFVQVYHATNDGIISGSLSFDGSDKDRLREVFAKYDVEIPEEEVTDNWLQYAITDTLSEEAAKNLATEIADLAADPKYKKTTNTVDVTDKYGPLMDNVFDGSYVHLCESLYRGKLTPGAKELAIQLADSAGSFNDRYADALYRMKANENKFTDDDAVVLHELLVYSTIEMMRALHLKAKTKPLTDVVQVAQGVDLPEVAYFQSLGPAAFQRELGGFAAEGARNNRTVSACGTSISVGGQDKDNIPGSLSDNPQNAFGGVDSATNSEATTASNESDDFGPLKFKCPKGHWNKRPRAKSSADFLTNCKTCGTSLKC